MIDMDFILWKHIDFSTFGEDLAVIHREDIYSPVYPSKEYFHFNGDWQLPDWLNWSVRPCNGALVYFGSQKFIQFYTNFALEFMKRTYERDDRLCCMVFAEQRWMAMCAEYLAIPVKELSSMDRLFDSKQSYFTHIWGYKQKLKDNQQAANKFCKKCAQRLSHDFPDIANKLADYSWASKYFGI